MARPSSVNLPTRCGHDHARHLQLDARRLAHPRGMHVCGQLSSGAEWAAPSPQPSAHGTGRVAQRRR